MASVFLSPDELKRNYFISKQKKKMVHIDLKSLRYKIWLWLVRECELWRILMKEFDKIPSMTLTKIITWLLLRNSTANLIFSKIEKRVRRKLSCVSSLKTRSRKEEREYRIIQDYIRSHPFNNYLNNVHS